MSPIFNFSQAYVPSVGSLFMADLCTKLSGKGFKGKLLCCHRRQVKACTQTVVIVLSKQRLFILCYNFSVPIFYKNLCIFVNPLPGVPSLGSSNSAANKI